MRIVLDSFSSWQFDELGHGERTRYKYRREVTRADDWLRSQKRKGLVQATAAELKAYLWTHPPNARTRNNVRQALVCFWRYLVDQGLAQENRAASLPRLPEPAALPRALTSTQARQIEVAANLAPPQIKTMLITYLYSGMRKNECRLLTWDQVDFDEAWIRIKGKGRAGGKLRMIPVHPTLLACLRDWRLDCKDPRWVFPSTVRRGYPVSESWVKERVRDFGDEIGIHLHPHLFRHTIATVMLERNVDIRSVQEFLGHANLSTTQIYTRVRPARLREAVEKVTFGEQSACVD